MQNRLKYGLLALASPLAIGAQNTGDRPNVILIYADDLGYGDLSCYGAEAVSTPNVDRLASNGIRFDNAYAPAATSTPSRYAMLTGEYAWRKPGTDVAAGDAAMIIKPQQYTLADLFSEAGYKTAVVGKWHLGLGEETGKQDWNAPLKSHTKDLGFDYSYIMAATADRVPCVFIEQGQVANYDPTAPISVSYARPFESEPLGRDRPDLLYNLKHSHGHDMAIVNGIGRIGYMKGGGKALWRDEDIADSIATKAISFIERHHKEPFFLYLATNDVHVPRFPHPRFRGKSPMGLRGEAIMQFDYTVGQVLQTLDRLGLTENTLIILSSDNGAIVDDGYADRAKELLGDHKPSGQSRSYKYSAFDGGARIPALVHWPRRIQQPSMSREVVSQIDWFASFAKLVGRQIPEGAAPDSRDALEAWISGKADQPLHIITQAANKTLAIRQGCWKYIEPKKGPKMIMWGPEVETGNCEVDQLYNMDEDPGETNNVAAQHPEIVARLKALLKGERAKTKIESKNK